MREIIYVDKMTGEVYENHRKAVVAYAKGNEIDLLEMKNGHYVQVASWVKGKIDVV